MHLCKTLLLAVLSLAASATAFTDFEESNGLYAREALDEFEELYADALHRRDAEDAKANVARDLDDLFEQALYARGVQDRRPAPKLRLPPGAINRANQQATGGGEQIPVSRHPPAHPPAAGSSYLYVFFLFSADATSVVYRRQSPDDASANFHPENIPHPFPFADEPCSQQRRQRAAPAEPLALARLALRQPPQAGPG